MRNFAHIAVTVAFLLTMMLSCSRNQAKVIPRDEMAEIYADMLVTDQWIVSTPSIRLIADTSLVYEPILEKYGYTSDDYRMSVDHYMDDPERFAKIFRETADILDVRLNELKRLKGDMDDMDERRKEAEKFRPDLKPEEFFPYLFEEPYVHYYDSISFEPDSVLMIYRLLSVETSDTLYDRIRMIIRADSLELADTLPQPDTLLESADSSGNNISRVSGKMMKEMAIRKFEYE